MVYVMVSMPTTLGISLPQSIPPVAYSALSGGLLFTVWITFNKISKKTQQLQLTTSKMVYTTYALNFIFLVSYVVRGVSICM